MHLGKNKKIDLIKNVPLFARCSRKELAEIAALADEIDIAEGSEIIREGERGREFFVILDGEAVVRRKGRKLATLSSGDFVGEIALVSRIPRTASVKTATPTRVLVITDQAFRSVMHRSPQIQEKVLEALAERVSEHTF